MKFSLGKNAQAETSYVIMLIAIFMIVYVILLPEGQKESVFLPSGSEEPWITGAGGPTGIGGPSFKNLISESPGLLLPFSQKMIQKPLASVSLFSTTSQDTESLGASFDLASSVFGKESKEFLFKVDDLNSLEEIRLMFFVLRGDGELVVRLNGVEVLSGEITSEMLPITLPKNYIKKINRLEFEVISPGFFKFMFRNRYVLKDVSLVKDYVVENVVEQRTFILSPTERRNLNRLTLYYILNCFTLEEQGRLGIKLNGKMIHDGLVVCDAGFSSIDLNPMEMVEGRNVLEFGIDKGKYNLEQVLLEGDVAQDEFPKYDFIVQVPDMQSIFRGAHVTLQLKFLNDGFRKAGAVYVNGYPIYFDTNGNEVIEDVSGLVYEGQNTVVIVPQTAFETTALLAFLS